MDARGGGGGEVSTPVLILLITVAVVASLRSLAEDATAPRPMFSREYLREELLKALRVVEARLDAAAPPSAPAP